MHALFLAVAFLLLAYHVEAATYNVRKTSSSDSFTCAQAQVASTAKLTIKAGLACLSAGDTLSIGPGTYAEHLFGDTLSTAPSGGYNVIPSGISSSQPTIIEGIAPSTVIIQSPSGVDSTVSIYNRNNITIRYLNFDCINSAISCILLGQTNGITVEYSKFHDTTNAIPFSQTCVSFNNYGSGNTNWTFRNNEVYNCGPVGGTGNGVYLSYVTGPFFVENNHIHDIRNYGVHSWNGASTEMQGGTVRWNLIKDTLGGCILASMRSNAEYYGNICSNAPSTNTVEGIAIGGYGVATSNVKISNNTIYGSPTNNYCIRVRGSGGNAVTVINNVCIDNLSNVSQDDGSGDTFSNNTASTDETLLIDVTDLRFSPRESSALIDGGTATGLPTGFGYVGSAPDRGALEAPIYFSSSVEAADANAVQVTFSMPTQSVRSGTGLQNCVLGNLGVTVNVGAGDVARTVTSCVITGTGTIRVVFDGAAVSSGNTVKIAYTRSAVGLYDNVCFGGSPSSCRNTEVRTFSAQTAINNTGAPSSQTWAVTSFKCFDWYGSVASPKFYPSGIAENTQCKVMFGGKLAVAVNIACTGANCDPTSFEYKWNLNAGSKSSLTDSATSNLIAFSNTAPSITDGQSIGSALITDPHGSFVAGAVVGQQSTQPTVDLTQNSSTQVVLLLQTNASAVVGSSYCLYPERTGGTAITYTQTPCFSIVNPAGGTPY